MWGSGRWIPLTELLFDILLTFCERSQFLSRFGDGDGDGNDNNDDSDDDDNDNYNDDDDVCFDLKRKKFPRWVGLCGSLELWMDNELRNFYVSDCWMVD